MNSKARQQHVEQMNANMAIEGFYPDESDIILQKGYINGTVTIDDLLRHAREYAETKGNAGVDI